MTPRESGQTATDRGSRDPKRGGNCRARSILHPNAPQIADPLVGQGRQPNYDSLNPGKSGGGHQLRPHSKPLTRKPPADNYSTGYMHVPFASRQHGMLSSTTKHMQNPCKMGQTSKRKEISPTQQNRLHRAQAEPNSSKSYEKIASQD